MRIIDVSTTIEDGMRLYEGDPEFKLKKIKTVTADGTELSEISMCAHAGTHVDAPAHYLKGGQTIDEIELGKLSGTAIVCEVADKAIDAAELTEHEILEGDIVLFKTDQNTYLSQSGADYLVAKKIKACGIDSLSIEDPYTKGGKTHKKLLSKGILIIEGLNLKNVKSGRYSFQCLPLKIKGCEAAPARCILVED